MFGAKATTSSPFSFGSTTSLTGTKSLFVTPSTSTTSSSFFGSTPASPAPLFGSSTSTSGLFNSSTVSKPLTTGGGLFNFTNPQQQQQQQQQLQQSTSLALTTADLLARSLTSPELYGDERDLIIAKLNQIEAFCGTGRGFLKAGVDPIEYTLDGPFCRFKTIGFNRKQSGRDADGLVLMNCCRPWTDLNTGQQQQAFVDILFKILGNKPNLHAHIKSSKALSENSCQVLIFCTEINEQTGSKRRIFASELAQFLNQNLQKQQLQNQLSIDQVIPWMSIDDASLQTYLNTPPIGFDRLLWEQARKDNPDPDHLIPWPIRGFTQLRDRQKLQTKETESQQRYLQEINSRICSLEGSVANLDARNTQMKINQNRLSNRLIKILAVQLIHQRFGFALDAEEERLQGRLEVLNSQLNAPAQLKGRLGELLSIFRCQPELLTKLRNNTSAVSDVSAKSSDKVTEAEREMRRYLGKCQEGLEAISTVLDRDSKDLQIIAKSVEYRRF